MHGVTPLTVPGGLPAARFLARHWQRRALLVRNAMPGFRGTLTRSALFRLAARDDVEARLVMHAGSRFSLANGPFRAADLHALPARDWTLLVQGVNLYDAATDTLLRRFAFVPYARLDDVMVSYAVPGGGVGPHVDSYDVFLLQGTGRRRWRYGPPGDTALRPDLPVRILRRFTPKHDVVLDPGDMLYVPPGHGHEGIAVDTCTTYSIGFRAPAHQELVEGFLDRLRDTLTMPGRYTDRGRRPSLHPARLDSAMLTALARPLQRICWTAQDLREFLGTYLSEPKANVAFVPARPAMTPSRFRASAGHHGIALDLRTQLLYDTRTVYINGTAAALPPRGESALRELADARALSAARCRRLGAETMNILHDWYRHGYLHPAA